MRVIGLSLLICVMIAVMVLTTRFWGLGQIHKPFESKFYTDRVEKVIYIENTADFDKLKEMGIGSDLILYFPIKKNTETKKLTILDKSFEDFFKEFSVSGKNGVNATATTTATATATVAVASVRGNDLKNTSEIHKEKSEKSVEGLLSNRMILSLDINIQDIHEEFKTEFDKVTTDELQSRIVIQSAYNTIRDSIKKYYPMMVYGSTSGDTLRFNVFQNIGVETAIPFKGDVFITTVYDKKVKIIDEVIRNEMKRRHKKVYIGPIQNEAELQLASSLKPDGYIFTVQTFDMSSKIQN